MTTYLVGGAVRDKLLGLEPKDLDYCIVGSTPEELLSLGYTSVGKDFPVFLHPTSNQEYALARTDRKMSPGYNGFFCDVHGISIETDLERRDLTINSIAQAPDGTLIDPFNGQADILSKTLRHTSQAFSEDPIRVLRIARLRARFGPYWKIHSSTKLLIDTMHSELTSLQPDRVYAEVAKVMDSPNSYIFFQTLDELNVLHLIFPFIHDLKSYREGSVWHQEPNVFEHTMTMLKHADHEPALIKWMILYHDIVKPLSRRLYGNGSGHDSATLAEPRIDIKLPKSILKPVLFHIDIHQRIFKIFDGMRYKKVTALIESFKKDRSLLDAVLLVSHYDKLGATRLSEPTPSDFTSFLQAFDEISAYRPKPWIEASNNPSGEAIKQHIHTTNISIVRKYL